MKGLKDTELRMAAEIAMAKGRGWSFDTRATALALRRARRGPSRQAQDARRGAARHPAQRFVNGVQPAWGEEDNKDTV